MDTWEFAFQLPVIAMRDAHGKVAIAEAYKCTGLALVFHRTRFTINSVSLDPQVAGMRWESLNDRGVLVTWTKAPQQGAVRLLVEATGQPLVVSQQFLVVAGLPMEQRQDDWTCLPEGLHVARLRRIADPLVEIEGRQQLLMHEQSPLTKHRLFFARVDRCTDIRAMGNPPRLPKDVPAPRRPKVVLDALPEVALVDALAMWVINLARTGTELPLTKGWKYKPADWIEETSTYLKNVLEHAFRAAFDRPLVTADGKRVDRDFEVAFEEFANGNLGRTVNGAPVSQDGFPDSAYFFSFAAFAWLAKKVALGEEKAFWELIWPVWAYTAEIYRRRYTPSPAGGVYKAYTYLHRNDPVSPEEIKRLHTNEMSLADFRAILKKACVGC